MNNSDVIGKFLRSAETFVTWVTGPSSQSDSEAAIALGNLSTLYCDALSLMKVDVGRDESSHNLEECRVTVDEWKEVYERLSNFPFTYFQESEVPHESDSELVFTDLSEGVTDIYQDVAEGLKLYKVGEEEQALCHWQMTFEYHWGRHCLSAMKALHTWFQGESDFQIFQK